MKCIVLGLLSVLVTSAESVAQDNVRVTGTAFNPYEFSEAVVPGVRIVFTAGETQHNVITDEKGQYEIRLPAAVYQISGGRPGFCPINRPSVRIPANTETLVNVRLIFCGIADGAEVGKDGKVIRDVSWPVSPFKIETRRVDTARGKRELLFEFATQTKRSKGTEYKGTLVDRDNVSAAVIYGVLTIYADSIFLDENSTLLQATGHVIVENRRMRRRANVASINLSASDVVGSVTIEGEGK